MSVFSLDNCINTRFLCWKNAESHVGKKISHYIVHFYEVNKGALLLAGARQIGKTYSIM